jgi:hypothetical protein
MCRRLVSLLLILALLPTQTALKTAPTLSRIPHTAGQVQRVRLREQHL